MATQEIGIGRASLGAGDPALRKVAGDRVDLRDRRRQIVVGIGQGDQVQLGWASIASALVSRFGEQGRGRIANRELAGQGPADRPP
jgi:hypothetical protein